MNRSRIVAAFRGRVQQVRICKGIRVYCRDTGDMEGFTGMTEDDTPIETQLLRKRVRATLWFFTVSLVFWESTAFPLQWEIDIL